MPLGTEVELGPGYIVLDGDPAPPPPKMVQQLPRFWPMWPNGRPSQLLLSICFNRKLQIYNTFFVTNQPQNHSNRRRRIFSTSDFVIGFVQISQLTLAVVETWIP